MPAVRPRLLARLSPTVKLDIGKVTTSVDRTVGNGGLMGYGYIPANLDINPGGSPAVTRHT